jgi:hypothetical protein
MIRSSRYLHVVDLGGGSALLIHALSQVRLTVDAQVAGFVRWFETPRKVPGDAYGARRAHGFGA